MENAKTKPYTLRELTADDMFPLVAILDAIGIEKIVDCFTVPEVAEEADTDKTAETAEAKEKAEKYGKVVFLKIAKIVIANVKLVKDDLYTLLSQLSGMTRKEVGALPMNTFIQMIVDVVKQVNFKDFFPDVSK